MTDPFDGTPAVETPVAEPPPLELVPMRPLDSPPPDPMDPRWVYQYEVLGERVVVHVHGALSNVGLLPTVRIVNGEGRDLSGLFPELDDLADLTTAGPFTIDGILTAPNPASDITYRLASTDPADALLRAESSPVSLVVDPADALLEGQHLPIPMPHLLSRRLDSRYFPGMSGRAWLRSAYSLMRRTEIVGWLDDRPGDQHHIDGILVAGAPDEKGNRRVQAVRAGLTMSVRDQLVGLLLQLPVRGAPKGLRYEMPEHPGHTVVRWARPGAVATIMGVSMASDRLLDHPVLLEVSERA